MKSITTSAYTFRKIIEEDFIYVDKTALLHLLVQKSGQFFLSRPRRFGKSLTLSTLEQIFKGSRPLFKGLAIDTLPYAWMEFPIIRIDLGDKHASSADELRLGLAAVMRSCARRHEVELQEPLPNLQFAELIELLVKKHGSPVVVLIDEYDKPILGNAHRPNELPPIVEMLKGFYSVVKAQDANIRFAFITGVSRFSRVSIFSDLNNLTDLTMDPRFSTLCGYTQKELEYRFSEHIGHLAKREGCSRKNLLAKVRDWYNGYRFSEGPATVYNPVSIGKLFSEQRFDNFWFETGTPKMLVNLMKQRKFDIERVKKDFFSSELFMAYEVERIGPLPLLFQTGYLTIKDVNSQTTPANYRLDYPNREVEQAFTKILLADHVEDQLLADSCAKSIREAFWSGNLDEVFLAFRRLISGIPYSLHIPLEKYYQSLFVMLFRLLGFSIEAEVQTDGGRIDAVVKNAKTIYVLEFKLNGTAKAALTQIRKKRYCEPYLLDGREVIAVGASISHKEKDRNLKDWKLERIRLFPRISEG